VITRTLKEDEGDSIVMAEDKSDSTVMAEDERKIKHGLQQRYQEGSVKKLLNVSALLILDIRNYLFLIPMTGSSLLMK